MNNNDFFGGMLAGSLLGVGILTCLIAFTPGSLFKDAKAAIEECESEIPRSVQCVVTAVPELRLRAGN